MLGRAELRRRPAGRGRQSQGCFIAYTPAAAGADVPVTPDAPAGARSQRGRTIRYLRPPNVTPGVEAAGPQYLFMDFVRTLPIGLLALVYAIVVVAVARWRGLRAMVGLGEFNDVTITRSSAVWELYELAPDTSARAPFTSAMRIGRDHIASTVHTIAFAYAGSALPGLILVSLHDRSLLEPLISSELAEEVVHILVGPIGLVPAIPVTTAVAVARVKATGRGAQPQPA